MGGVCGVTVRKQYNQHATSWQPDKSSLLLQREASQASCAHWHRLTYCSVYKLDGSVDLRDQSGGPEVKGVAQPLGDKLMLAIVFS